MLATEFFCEDKSNFHSMFRKNAKERNPISIFSVENSFLGSESSAQSRIERHGFSFFILFVRFSFFIVVPVIFAWTSHSLASLAPSLFLVTGWWLRVRLLEMKHNSISFGNKLHIFFPQYNIGIERVFEHVCMLKRRAGVRLHLQPSHRVCECLYIYIYVDIYVHTKRGAREKNNCVRDSDENVPQK